MRQYYSTSRKVFLFFVTLFFVILCLTCIVPFLHVLALSFSHKIPAMKGKVAVLPLGYNEAIQDINVGLNFNSYTFIFSKPDFIRAFMISAERVILAGVITMFVIIITAYPLSKLDHQFRGRVFYV